jgi:4-amino-4-deoxy-L-arabinose transferase-like glycosyltransferase
MAQEKPQRLNYIRWFGVVTLTGCLGFIIALIALIVGLWIDSLMGRRGPVTICLLVLSVPLNLFIMVKIAFLLTRYLRPLNPNTTINDDDDEEV